MAQKGSKRRQEAQKGARKGCSSLPGAASALEEASVPPVRSKRLFERAVRDRCSQKLVSVALCSEPLHSALLCSVHGYARVHASIYNIYIYIYVYIYIYIIYIYIYPPLCSELMLAFGLRA